MSQIDQALHTARKLKSIVIFSYHTMQEKRYKANKQVMRYSELLVDDEATDAKYYCKKLANNDANSLY
jgi:hypothetical protein